MSTYEEQLNEITSTVYDSNYEIYNSMSDDNDVVTIQDRDVMINNIGTIVKGDSNSQMITFKISRYYEGVDLSEKSIDFIYSLFGSSIVESQKAVNVEVDESYITFRWLISSNVTQSSGVIKAAIQFSGTDELNKTYLLKTKTFSIKIEDTLS